MCTYKYIKRVLCILDSEKSKRTQRGIYIKTTLVCLSYIYEMKIIY